MVKEQNVNVINFDNIKVKIKLAEVGTLKGVGRKGTTFFQEALS